MNKLFLTFYFAFIAATVFAQNGSSPLSLSILGGGSGAFFGVKSTSTAHSSFEPSGTVGASLDYKFNDYFSICPAVLLSGKGGSVTDQFDSYDGGVNTTYDFIYVEESLCFIVHKPIGDVSNIYMGAGPYYANPIWGRTNYYTDSQHISFGKNGDFSSSDYGISSLIGYETPKGYTIALNFDLGLSNVRQNNFDNYANEQFKNRAIYLSFGLRL